MRIEEIATVCQQRSERDPEQERRNAYGDVARHLEERRQIALVQLATDLEQWIGAHQQSAQRSCAQGGRFLDASHMEKTALTSAADNILFSTVVSCLKKDEYVCWLLPLVVAQRYVRMDGGRYTDVVRATDRFEQAGSWHIAAFLFILAQVVSRGVLMNSSRTAVAPRMRVSMDIVCSAGHDHYSSVGSHFPPFRSVGCWVSRGVAPLCAGPRVNC